jgi:hypothetical protein
MYMGRPYYPWWLDNLADDVTGEGAAMHAQWLAGTSRCTSDRPRTRARTAAVPRRLRVQSARRARRARSFTAAAHLGASSGPRSEREPPVGLDTR